jgi:DNA-binding NarL/FixJ family response regulator
MVQRMSILVAVDDLLFSSKIRATAKHLGVSIVFARSASEVLDQARALQPALTIFDLNSQRFDSIAALGALKRDPLLSRFHAVAFASHVHTDLIAAARSAGADEVLPRSAFAANLADILLRGQDKG